MRLIDADYLLKIFDEKCKHHCDDCGYFNNDFYCELINNAPTVEVTKPQSYVMGFCDGLKAQTYEKPPMFERPQGYWNYIQAGMAVCPFCGASPHKQYKNFCPNCGADMRGSVR